MLVKSINEGKQYFAPAFNRAKYTRMVKIFVDTAAWMALLKFQVQTVAPGIRPILRNLQYP